jgi:O-antigen/teichoic acid export membrane protein
VSVKRIIGRNVAWNIAGLTVETSVGFLIMPFLIFRLGESSYGIWMILGALTSYFGLLDIGVRGSIGRHVALHRSSGNHTAMNQTVTGGVVVVLIVGLIAIFTGLIFGEQFFRIFEVPLEKQADTLFALQLVTVQFAFYLLATSFDATLWGLQRFDWINLIDIPAILLRGGLTFALVQSDHDLITLAWITLGVSVATALAKYLLCLFADAQLRIGIRFLDRASLRELIVYGSWNLIANVAVITRRQLTPLLIGSLLGLSFVAPFSVATKLLGPIAAALGAVTGVLTPYSTVLHANSQSERQKQLFLLGGRYSTTLALFLTAFLLVVGDSLIELWIGHSLGQAALLLAILAVGELLPSSQFVTNGILMAKARNRVLAGFALLEMLTVFLLSIILIPHYGLIGAGLAIAIPAFFTRGVGPLIYGCRVVAVPVSRFLTYSILTPLLCATLPILAIAFAVDAHLPHSWLLFVLYGVGYSVLFGLFYVALMGRTLWRRFARRTSTTEPNLAAEVSQEQRVTNI